jgi:lysophospholipid acyltransferase (LPLAT)-like uncharacterized protein
MEKTEDHRVTTKLQNFPLQKNITNEILNASTQTIPSIIHYSCKEYDEKKQLNIQLQTSAGCVPANWHEWSLCYCRQLRHILTYE